MPAPSALRRLFGSLLWRTVLGLGILSIVAVSAVFNYNTTAQLRQSERNGMEFIAEALKDLPRAEDPTLHLRLLELNTTIPTLLADDAGRVIDAFNYGDKTPAEQPDFFERELADLKASGAQPFVVEDAGLYRNYVYYRPSRLIAQLAWFPYIQFGLLTVVLLLVYLTWSAARRAEQERVWVGMAKETAHQLGTPITSLMGWVENLQALYPDDENIEMITSEISKDVLMLEMVAERFSKIGAAPELTAYDLYALLDTVYQYIRQRAPRKVHIEFPAQPGTPLPVQMNPVLFRWVLENLLKNALDAMEGKGEIRLSVREEGKRVLIDVRDTGKGIAPGQFRRVFQPGFTTKKRGWGLGLSLCKRIVEQYHRGRIFVAESVQGQGTTFRIVLPLRQA